MNNTYNIHNITTTPDGNNLIVQYQITNTSENNKSYKKICFNNYRQYKQPTNKHMVEPDGNIFVCKDSISKPSNICNIHNRPMGCKFHLGKNYHDFKNRTQQIIDHCRCYCKQSTQYDFDKWCYFDKIKNNSPLCDNGKIYKRLCL